MKKVISTLTLCCLCLLSSQAQTLGEIIEKNNQAIEFYVENDSIQDIRVLKDYHDFYWVKFFVKEGKDSTTVIKSFFSGNQTFSIYKDNDIYILYMEKIKEKRQKKPVIVIVDETGVVHGQLVNSGLKTLTRKKLLFWQAALNLMKENNFE